MKNYIIIGMSIFSCELKFDLKDAELRGKLLLGEN